MDSEDVPDFLDLEPVFVLDLPDFRFDDLRFLLLDFDDDDDEDELVSTVDCRDESLLEEADDDDDVVAVVPKVPHNSLLHCVIEQASSCIHW